MCGGKRPEVISRSPDRTVASVEDGIELGAGLIANCHGPSLNAEPMQTQSLWNRVREGERFSLPAAMSLYWRIAHDDRRADQHHAILETTSIFVRIPVRHHSFSAIPQSVLKIMMLAMCSVQLSEKPSLPHLRLRPSCKKRTENTR